MSLIFIVNFEHVIAGWEMICHCTKSEVFYYVFLQKICLNPAGDWKALEYMLTLARYGMVLYLRRFVRFDTICTILKMWKNLMKECLVYNF